MFAWKSMLPCANAMIVMGNYTAGSDSNPSKEGSAFAKTGSAEVQSSGSAMMTKKMRNGSDGVFQMPLHYPRYKKSDYENMEEWRIDSLLREYGLFNFAGTTLDEKRNFAVGAFIWPDQN